MKAVPKEEVLAEAQAIAAKIAAAGLLAVRQVTQDSFDHEDSAMAISTA